ncbi:hypothetical protein VJ923_05150 [Adlercreutzia sp. R25]|uniref:hypothetical protein n=1 Tax=Adlercreutzia shanghongiae TaxID=3111773 RepID=UPI002DB6F153|nr:hypothetical protein [Adlercreutzia sp. R25]MEC4272546.1 hypothetical protein [Adlercreutzia sp. R25]
MAENVAVSWGSALGELRRWASAQEGVKLAPGKISVPKPARDEFYRRASQVQKLLAASVLADEMAAAEVLARRFSSAREGLCRAAGLSRYALAPRLEQFVEDPREAAARPLQALVLDAASGLVPLAEVDGAAREAARAPFEVLLRAAYEAWVYLSVVSALGPVRFWVVAAEGPDSLVAVETDEVRAGWQVPSRELRVPEAVFRTREGETYALKMECAREIDYYDAMVPLARDTSAGGNTFELLGHRVLLLYRLADEGSVAPVVNRKEKRQVHCDLAVSVLAPREMENRSYLGVFIQRAQKLRIKRPLQVVTYGAAKGFPLEMADDPAAPAVCCRQVGLDEEALGAIARELQSEPIRNVAFNPISH